MLQKTSAFLLSSEKKMVSLQTDIKGCGTTLKKTRLFTKQTKYY